MMTLAAGWWEFFEVWASSWLGLFFFFRCVCVEDEREGALPRGAGKFLGSDFLDLPDVLEFFEMMNGALPSLTVWIRVWDGFKYDNFRLSEELWQIYYIDYIDAVVLITCRTSLFEVPRKTRFNVTLYKQTIELAI